MKIRRELWFGFTVMALIVTPVLILTPWGNLVDAHLTREDLGTLGLLMLALVVVDQRRRLAGMPRERGGRDLVAPAAIG